MGFRTIVTVLSLLLMVTSTFGAVGIGVDSYGNDAAATRSALAVDLGQEGAPHPPSIHASATGSRDSRADSTMQDTFEIVNPYPTANSMNGIAWSPDGGEAILVGDEGFVMTYDGYNFDLVPSVSNAVFYDVAWHPDGSYALIAGEAGLVYKFDPVSRSMERIYAGTSLDFYGVDFHPDGEYALLVGANGIISKFNGTTIVNIAEWTNTVVFEDVSFRHDGDYCFIVGGEFINNGRYWTVQGRVLKYDGVGFESLELGSATNMLYQGADWSVDDEKALIVGDNGMIVYDGTDFGTVYTNGQTYLTDVSFMSSGSIAFAVGFGGTVIIYKDGYASYLNSPSQEWLTAVDCRPYANTALAVGYYGVVLEINGNTVRELDSGVHDTLYDVQWKPDLTYALLVGNGGTIVKYDGKKLKMVSSPTQNSLLGASWNPNQPQALIVGSGGIILDYSDAYLGDPIVNTRFSGTTQTLRDVEWGPNGDVALMVGDSGTVLEWRGGRASKVVSGSTASLYSVAWSDANTAYIAGSGGTVLEYKSTPPSRIKAASIIPKMNSAGFILDMTWDSHYSNGFIVGTTGYFAEHFKNMDATPLDDSYTIITTNTNSMLMGIDWKGDFKEVMVVGAGGTTFLYNLNSKKLTSLTSPVSSDLWSVGWKGKEYALIAGANGLMMKYYPNLPPANLTLSMPTNISDNSMKLTWSKCMENDFNRYELHMATKAAFTISSSTRVATITDAQTTSKVVSNLEKNTIYYFKVRVVDNGALLSDSNEVYAKTTIGMLPPSPVTLYSPDKITNTAMSIHWSENVDVDFDRYEVHISTNALFQPSSSTLVGTISDQTELKFLVQDLKSSTTYYIIIRVYDKDGLFADSNTVSGTTSKVENPPAAVVLNDPYNLTQTSFEVNWTENTDPDFDSYEVHMAQNESFNITTQTKVAAYTQANQTHHQFLGLKENTTYYVKVRVYDTAVLFNDSNEVSAKTRTPNPLPIPVVLRVPENVTEVSVVLNWTMNLDLDFQNYEVHASKTKNFVPNGGANGTMKDKVFTQNVTKYNVTNLESATTWYFKVLVYDTANQSSASNEVSAVLLGNNAPKNVTLYEPVLVTDTSVTLEWSQSNESDFDKYEVHMGTSGNFTPDVYTMKNEIKNKIINTSVVTGLDANKTYYFVVRVVDKGGLYNDSNMVNATTLGPNVPPEPVILDFPRDITRTSMNLTWTMSLALDFDRYELHQSKQADEFGEFETTESTLKATFTDSNTTRYMATNLTSATDYYLVVKVFDKSGLSSNSNFVNDTTLPPNKAPQVNAGQDQTVTVDEEVKFKGTAIDEDGTIALYEWDTDGDGTFDFQSTTTGETKTTFSVADGYTLSFKATDNEGANATDTVFINVRPPAEENKAPKADAGPDKDGKVGYAITFDGSGTDEDGIIIQYEWDFDGDDTYDDMSTTSGVMEWTFDDAGTFKAKLRVTDNASATATDTTLVTISEANIAPNAEITSPDESDTFTTDEWVKFDGSQSSDTDNDPITFKWTSSEDGELSTESIFSKKLSAGDHMITLEVSDPTDSTEVSVNITVEEPKNKVPTIELSSPSSNEKVSGKFTIDGKANDDDGTVESVLVKIDSGSWVDAKGTTSWSYEWDTSKVANGRHTIKVKAVDDRDGESNEVSVTVTVNNAETKKPGKGIPGFEGPFTAMAMMAAAATLVLLSRKRRN